tara:strand:- start:369 stop:1283 length:915 start_codon:yes stop_codon:yes gene_type:complete
MNRDDEIDILEILGVLFQGKWIIVLITTFAAILAVLYSLSLPNLYQSNSVLVPHDSSSSGSSPFQGVSGLASLAGVNLTSQGADSNSVKAIKKIKTLSFFENNILPNIFLPELMAIKSWNPKTNILIFDEDIYDESSKTWVRNFSYPKELIPSAQESFEIFKKNFSISQDNETGFITLKTKHQSPFVAKKWAEILVDEINLYFEKKDKLKAEKSVLYLNKNIAKTNLTEIKQVMASLLQQETQKLMLIEASESYVFEYLDPPAVMEKKSEPRRSSICILGTMVGFIVGILIVLARFYIFNSRNS